MSIAVWGVHSPCMCEQIIPRESWCFNTPRLCVCLSLKCSNAYNFIQVLSSSNGISSHSLAVICVLHSSITRVVCYTVYPDDIDTVLQLCDPRRAWRHCLWIDIWKRHIVENGGYLALTHLATASDATGILHRWALLFWVCIAHACANI